MKLSSDTIALVKARLGAEPISETTLSHDHLSAAFGSDTFYLGPSGAYVFEAECAEADRLSALRAVQIASWADDNRTLLQSHGPIVTDLVVPLQVH
jgi:hypothetical protein